MERFDFQGWPIAYAHAGRGEPIVLLHNGGSSHAIWRELMARLEDDYQLFALDLLGYGASAKPASGYTLENYAAMLAAFLAHRELARVTLVGNCMGSAISLRFAQERPEAVRALVLINPLTEATLAAGGLRGLYDFRRLLPGLSARVYARLGARRLPRWLGPVLLRAQLGAHGRARRVHRSQELCECFASEGQLRSLLAVLDDVEAYAALDRFVPAADFPPICTIWGADNLILSVRAGRALNLSLRPRREEWMRGTGHLPMLEQSQQVASIVREFLSACSARRRECTGSLAAHEEGAE
jgi:pimeloyl-ACP methyl ester carboxylesterase